MLGSGGANWVGRESESAQKAGPEMCGAQAGDGELADGADRFLCFMNGLHRWDGPE